MESEPDGNDAGAFVEEEDEDTSEEDDAYYECDPPDGEEDGSEEEYYDALATFNSAKKLDFAKKKFERGYNVDGNDRSREERKGSKGSKGRGRSSSVSGSHYAQAKSIDEEKAGSTCSDCGQQGHWHGDAVCPKAESGKTPLYKKKPAGKNVVELGDGEESDVMPNLSDNSEDTSHLPVD